MDEQERDRMVSRFMAIQLMGSKELIQDTLEDMLESAANLGYMDGYSQGHNDGMMFGPGG